MTNASSGELHWKTAIRTSSDLVVCTLEERIGETSFSREQHPRTEGGPSETPLRKKWQILGLRKMYQSSETHRENVVERV